MEAIQKILRQAEIQQLQLELRHQFLKNIHLFSERFPNIAKKFEARESQNITLQLDSENNLNLYHQEKRCFLYSEPPTEYCSKQVSQFKTNRTMNRLYMGGSPVYNQKHIHIKKINELVKRYESQDIPKKYDPNSPITNLIMGSLGIGFHLPKLINELDIINLFIYEAELDIFQASLSTIDWRPILDHFKQNNRSITFCLGVEPHIAMSQVESSINSNGLHNHIYTTIYKHGGSKNEAEFIDYYISQINSSASGLGYFDDEQIGLAHTFQNLSKNPPIFVHNKKQTSSPPPVFIVGNGPSLDKHKAYLLKNKGGAIIFSCGTSFGSLTKMGIKPDYHIEMERTISMKDILDFSTTPEDRNGVTLLCLNPVSPAILDSFEDYCIGLKQNDVATPVVEEYYQPSKVQKLPFSNPTVSNSALSFAIAMGFKEVYLIGVDLGLKEDGQHHSLNSPHYKLEEHIENIDEAIYTYADGKEYVKGNFSGKVKTHSTLNLARKSIEKLIYYTKSAHQNFNCYNSNDGAFIEGTTTKKISDLPNFSDIDKSQFKKSIQKGNFLYSNKAAYLKNKRCSVLEQFFQIIPNIKMKDDISNDVELHSECQRIYSSINANIDPITHYLMRGTVNCFLAIITQHCSHSETSKQFQLLLKTGIESYNATIDLIFDFMKRDPFQLDDTHNPTLHRLNNKIKDDIKINE